MIFNMHMFGTLAVFVLTCHFEGSYIVLEDFAMDASLLQLWYQGMGAHFIKEVNDRNGFTEGGTQADIFGFTAAEGDVGLQLAFPADWTAGIRDAVAMA